MRLLPLATLLLASAVQAAEPVTVDVYRDANCGCCKAWMSHLKDSGLQVNDHVETDMAAVKQRLGVPQNLTSCHTAVVDGKFVEGHVPAKDILELRQHPELRGAAVAGMPQGAPGMETGMQQAYQVIGLDKDGKEQVLADYPAK